MACYNESLQGEGSSVEKLAEGLHLPHILHKLGDCKGQMDRDATLHSQDQRPMFVALQA